MKLYYCKKCKTYFSMIYNSDFTLLHKEACNCPPTLPTYTPYEEEEPTPCEREPVPELTTYFFTPKIDKVVGYFTLILLITSLIFNILK